MDKNTLMKDIQGIESICAKVKKNVQRGLFFGDSAQKEAENSVLKEALNGLIDEMVQRPLGRSVLKRLPEGVIIVSCSMNLESNTYIAESFPEIGFINILPDKLLSPQLSKIDKVEALSHECFHILNYRMQQGIEAHMGASCDLTAYDKFFLHALDEAAAHVGGWHVALEMKGIKDPHLNTDGLFKGAHYWGSFYMGMLQDIDGVENLEAQLQTKHMDTFYKIQAAYFDVYPHLRNPRLIGRIHQAFKLFKNVIQEDFKSPNKTEGAVHICDYYNSKLPPIAKAASELKGRGYTR